MIRVIISSRIKLDNLRSIKKVTKNVYNLFLFRDLAFTSN